MIRKIIYQILVGIFFLQILISGLVKPISQLIESLPIVKRLRRKFRAGNLISRLIRPVMEGRWVRAVFGANLATAVLVGSLGVPVNDYHAFLDHKPPVVEQQVMVFEPEEIEITTQEFEYVIPVEELIGVSTRFRGGHPGYDFRAPLGSGVRPIMNGRVIMIVHARFGYGRHVYLDHGNGLVTMYAHLGQIKVDENDEVTPEDALGEIGLTGWTTGPHLHFEVYQNGEVVNPRLLFEV